MKKINTEKLFRPILKNAEKQGDRPILTKACWNKSKKELVATDGHRLMVVLTKTQPQGKYTIPKGKDGNYPNYAQVVPGYREGCLPEVKDTKHVLVLSKELIPKLKQALALLKGTVEVGDCHFVRDKRNITRLQLCCSVIDVGSMHYEGANKKNKKVTLNLKYLYELVKLFHTLGEDEFEFHVTDELSPIVMIGKEVYAILMPHRT